MVAIVEADPRWADEYRAIAARLRDAAREGVVRVDHIGSTSVPGLAAKDVIDVQITAADDAALDRISAALAARAWRRRADAVEDHRVAGLATQPTEWRKVLFVEPEGERHVHVHVRVQGRANQRYALLFRDFLRAHPDAAEAYATVKKGLAALAPDADSYADAKDPACDLIYLAAEDWAKDGGWVP